MLLGNYSAFNRGPIRFRTGTATAGASFAFTYGNSNPAGWSHMIWQDGDSAARPEIGYPSGYYGRGWKMPLGKSSTTTKLQFLSGISALISFSGSATGVTARFGTGLALITISASASGGLFVPGSGLAAIVFSASGDIAGYVFADGSSTITITAVGSTLEAIGWPGGAATITIDADGDPLGRGWMEGTTAEGGLTNVGIANSVWNAIAASLNAPGTMGEKMNAAGTAGDPWLTPLPGGYGPGTAGDIIGNQVPDIQTLAEFLFNIEGGKWQIVGNQMIFYKADNVTEVARFNLFDSAGNPAMANVFQRQRA